MDMRGYPGETIEVRDRLGHGADEGAGATITIGLDHYQDDCAALEVDERSGASTRTYLDRSALIALIIEASRALGRIDGNA